ncbi:MAG: site-specific DNA-methyltransferase [Chloroflexi bacterium]|nr:site-specific DNA-methyltransferase [Chloroflexota bacterium]
MKISGEYCSDADVVLYEGDCLDLISSIPPNSTQLVVTSPPYNIGKQYEGKPIPLAAYLDNQKQVIKECVNLLRDGGSICWEVGNHIHSGEVYPLDALLYPIFKEYGLKLRNRIVWHYEHGLHSSRRFSGRYETILWFTKGNEYVFNLDPVRVPQKYPGKRYYKGPKVGQYSSNPLGKNPGDVWLIPNVKHNHPEKTVHPCQFPVELIERLILALTNPGDLVLDPYTGVGTTAIAAIRHGRRSAGADISPEYMRLARQRVQQASEGKLRIRPMGKPIYIPPAHSPLTQVPSLFTYAASQNGDEARLI